MSVQWFIEYLAGATVDWHSSLLRCCLASFGIMLVTWIAVWRLRIYSAALRHRVLWLGLSGLVVSPALVLLSVRVSPLVTFLAQSSTSVSKNPAGIVKQASIPSAIAESGEAGTKSNQTVFEKSEILDTKGTPGPVFSEAALRGSAVTRPINSDSNKPVTSDTFSRHRVSLRILAISVWGVVSLMLVFHRLLEQLFLKRILHRSIRITDEKTRGILRWIASQHRIAVPRLLCSESLQVPVVIGILRPCIALPCGYGKWSYDRLHVVLLHEMMHIGRADVLAQAFAGIATVMFWFNPLVWRAASRMRLERELASDDSVLLSGEDAVRYADHLVEIAAAMHKRYRIPPAALAMATHTNLQSRVSRLVQQDIDRRPLSRRASLKLLLVSSVFTAAVAIAMPAVALTSDASAAAESPDLARTEFTISGDLSVDWIDQLKKMPNLQKLTIRRPGKHFRSEFVDLKNLQTLYVEDFPLRSGMADIVLSHAVTIPKLRNVTFKGTGLTSDGLKKLKNSSIVELALIDEEYLTDEGFRHIGDMHSLETLKLTGTPVEATGLQHLQACPKLRELSLLKDRGATNRVPMIATLKHLEELTLDDVAYTDLVELKNAKSLRQLTLSRCGAKGASESLQQLTQLKCIRLDNADIVGESFADVRDRLSRQGIELIDATRLVDAHVSAPIEAIVNEATALARKVHRDMDIARNHATFWTEWSTTYSDIPSMQQEPIRTVNRLREALERDSVSKTDAVDLEKTIMAWSPGQFFSTQRLIDNNKMLGEVYKYGDATLAWERGVYGSPDSLTHIARNGMGEFADSLDFAPAQLSVSHQSYWWGKGVNRAIVTSTVSPDSATYRELTEEIFCDEVCRVLESAGRNERMWVSASTSRLRGMVTFAHQGFFAPFYLQPIVTKIVGDDVKSHEEYRRFFGDGRGTLSKEKQEQLTRAQADYSFDSAIPFCLYVFSDYREITPQKWYPFRVRSAQWNHNKQNEQYYSYLNVETTVSEVVLDRTDLKAFWTPLLPKEGEKIQDQRFSVPVDFTYREDQTLEDIEALANEQFFRFAESEAILTERRLPLNQMLNEPAPALPMERWIGTRPDLKGKSYLLHFWATWCGPCKNDIPLLNELSKKGIVIGVHPKGTSEEEILKAIGDTKMTYPTIMADSEEEHPLGYPVSMYPYCIRIDENGNVAKHGSLNDVLSLTTPTALKEDLPTGPIVFGKVLATKAQGGLLQFSLGDKDGIEPQQLVDVLRDGKRIAQVRVILTRENQSVGIVEPSEDFQKIEKGDEINGRVRASQNRGNEHESTR
jgi:beta-lactamase regulating signal transducer with metallopeptidase domain/thiol-disulfide isomerase/thioredoxin